MEKLNELALFAGAGGGILGGTLLGWRTVCAVEWEPYPASILCARQNDGLLPPFPIWDDVQTFDGFAWRGLERVLGDLTSLGYDAKWTVMGAADVGANHQRDRIWIVGKMGNTNNNGHIATEIRKSLAQGSNPSSTWQKQACEFKGSSEQYAELAYPLCNGLQGIRTDGSIKRQARLHSGERSNKEQGLHMAHSKNEGYVRWLGSMATIESQHNNRGSQGNGRRQWWEIEPNLGRVADGVAARVDRLKAIGNGQVPLCAATAWRLLK